MPKSTDETDAIAISHNLLDEVNKYTQCVGVRGFLIYMGSKYSALKDKQA